MEETSKKKRVRARRPPATSPEDRENQLISLAIDLAEEQLANKTASSQVITHFLKLATVKESLEREKLMAENELLKAKAENLRSSKEQEKMYAEALNAMKKYSGAGEVEEMDHD